MSSNKPDVILKWDEYQRLLDLEEELENKETLRVINNKLIEKNKELKIDNDRLRLLNSQLHDKCLSIEKALYLKRAFNV